MRGESFHALLMEFGLILPSTISGGGPTWRRVAGGSGGQTRFIGRSTSVLKSAVLPEDLLAIHDKVDRMAPMLDLCLHPPGAARPASEGGAQQRQSQRCYDHKALRLSTVQSKLAGAWEQAPPTPLSWAVDTTEAALTRFSRQLLAQHCPLGAPPPRRDWLTGETLAKVLVPAEVRRRFFDFCGLRSRTRARPMFVAWQLALGFGTWSSRGDMDIRCLRLHGGAFF